MPQYYSIRRSTPNGKATNVKLTTVGGELTVTGRDVTGKAGGAFREKIVNGDKTREFLPHASVDFKTPLGQTNISGRAELNLETGDWVLGRGTRLTVKTPAGDVTIANASTFNGKTGLMTKNNQQISLDLNKQTALVYEKTFDKTTQDALGVTYKFSDPKLALTVLATHNRDTGEVGGEVRAKLNVTPSTTLQAIIDTDYNGGPRGIFEVRSNF